MEKPEFDEAVDAIHHERQIRIICIGAGASGLCFAYKLQRSFRNFSLTVCPFFWLSFPSSELSSLIRLCKIYEKNPGISGTWYETTYPGLDL